MIERLPRSLRTVWKPRNRIVQASVARLPAELRRVRLLAFDLYPSSVTQFIADAHRILPADESVDAVEVQAVLEHVLEPKGARQVVDHTG